MGDRDGTHTMNKQWMYIFILLLFTGGITSAAVASGSATNQLAPMANMVEPMQCAKDGAEFQIAQGVSRCVTVGMGHKVVSCVVNRLQQNAYLLVTHTGFIDHPAYPIPMGPIYINQNQQRLVFMGVGTQKNTEMIFHYGGPWDPSYTYYLTCTVTGY